MNERRNMIADRHRVHVRVLSLVGFGMLAPMVVMAWVAWTSLAEIRQRVLAERELLARGTAAQLARVLGDDMEALHAVASSRGFDLQDGDAAPEREALHEAYLRRHAAFEGLFLLDRDGAVLAREPRAAAFDVPPVALEALRTGRMSVSDLVAGGDGSRRVFALVPVKDWRGTVVGLVGGAIDPRGAHLASMLGSLRLADGESVDLVDGRGTVMASSDATRVYRDSDHAGFIAGLIRGKQHATGACHGCHRGSDDRVQEVMAFAPLAVVPWGVIVRQPERAAFAFAGWTPARLTVLALALFAIALVFAWGASRSLTTPLHVLTEAAERLAAGRLGQPIPDLGPDEVGRLGRALERMRAALAESLDRVERAREELEQRVFERTSELQRVNSELRDREEGRGRLLEKVISAQEDERKRIARELHDETSQSLAALAMGLDTAISGTEPGEARRRLLEVKGLAVRTLDEVHRLIVDLRPSVLDDLGLRSAINWYAERALKKQGIAVRCEFSGVEARLPSQVETAVFRVVQETMTNIAKHARAETVLIQCSQRAGRLTIEIEDDGVGFEPDKLAAPRQGRGWGLMGIRERVELLGGTVQIESAPDQGTRIALSVPVPTEAANV